MSSGGIAAVSQQQISSSSQSAAAAAAAAAVAGAAGAMGVTGSALREDVFKAYMDKRMDVSWLGWVFRKHAWFQMPLCMRVYTVSYYCWSLTIVLVSDNTVRP
jgi:membrane associated rhomboid family serine protease